MFYKAQEGDPILSTMFWIVIVSAVLVLFWREFHEIYKKIFKSSIIKCLISLGLISFMVVRFQGLVLYLLETLSYYSYLLIADLGDLLPLHRSAVFFASIAVLMLVSFLPGLLINVWLKRRGYVTTYPYAFLIISFLWFIETLALTLGVSTK